MRKTKQVKAYKKQAAKAYGQGKKKEAYKLWDQAHKLRLEMQKKV
ncbi:hypothetical protein LCGC14_1053590 [marine sediment metagenome]|uniref:Uncharacterized protein n=1 Tax=marine sediment metagenome TaxID=412755 RepID=A0A0F9MN19_9ZZZZ